MFQKYALELLERLLGKAKKNGHDLEVSFINMRRANVVAQTKIHFNDKQLLQLIHQHLVSKGFLDTAAQLQKEAQMNNSLHMNNMLPPSKFRYATPTTPVRPMNKVCSLFQ